MPLTLPVIYFKATLRDFRYAFVKNWFFKKQRGGNPGKSQRANFFPSLDVPYKGPSA